jgi:hypothetical protein
MRFLPARSTVPDVRVNVLPTVTADPKASIWALPMFTVRLEGLDVPDVVKV